MPREIEMKEGQMTKTRTPKLYSYRFEIQDDNLVLCFSVVARSQAEAVRKANRALVEEHAVQTSAFNPAKVCLTEPIEDAVLYLADKQDQPITVDTGSIVDFVEAS